MRLREITETLVEPKFKVNPYSEPEYNHDQLRDMEDTPDERPYGSFAYADDRDSDPHEIKVKGYEAMYEDPKARFYLDMKHLMGSNTYMPIVYDIDQFLDDDTADLRHEVNMERLLSYKELEPSQFVSALRNFVNDVDNDENPSLDRFKKFVEIVNDLSVTDVQIGGRIKNLHVMLCKILTEYVEEPDTLPSDSRLYEFAQALDDLIVDTGNTLDLNPGNVMYRRTPTGTQIVISDPVF